MNRIDKTTNKPALSLSEEVELNPLTVIRTETALSRFPIQVVQLLLSPVYYSCSVSDNWNGPAVDSFDCVSSIQLRFLNFPESLDVLSCRFPLHFFVFDVIRLHYAQVFIRFIET